MGILHFIIVQETTHRCRGNTEGYISFELSTRRRGGRVRKSEEDEEEEEEEEEDKKGRFK